MGIVFGKQTVKEPTFDILLDRKDAKIPYEIRKYGERYAASVTYINTGSNEDSSSPFRTLARYIGVFGIPENEGKQSIDMTAPVVMEKEPESIAMTAPVVMENSKEDGDGTKKMMFMLPAEYDDMSKIPKPTNPNVHIEHISSEVGVVHRYNGNFNEKINSQKAMELYTQLITDGVESLTEESVMDKYQFWGYNPPFTIPYFKRNEVWLKVDDNQVSYLQEKFPPGVSGGITSGMTSKVMFGFQISGLVIGVFAIGILMKSRGGAKYSRLDG